MKKKGSKGKKKVKNNEEEELKVDVISFTIILRFLNSFFRLMINTK
jgi:hypothetical protein